MILYRYYDRNRQPLYFGVTSNLRARTLSHQNGSSWFDQAEYRTVDRFRSRQEALTAEAQAIVEQRPLRNGVVMLSLVNNPRPVPISSEHQTRNEFLVVSRPATTNSGSRKAPTKFVQTFRPTMGLGVICLAAPETLSEPVLFPELARSPYVPPRGTPTDLISYDQAAVMVGLHRRSIERAVRTKKLRGFVVFTGAERRVKVSCSEVLDLYIPKQAVAS